MSKYYTTQELSEIIKMAPGTIRNLVWKGVFIEGIHYVKPSARKVLFIWTAIEDWLHGRLVAGANVRADECLIKM